MSNQLSIQVNPPFHGSGDSPVPPRPAVPVQVPAAPEAKPVQFFVNPSFRFDASINQVVIEFHNDVGKVTNSIPSQRQLQAYRSHQEVPPGEAQATNPLQPVDGKAPAG